MAGITGAMGTTYNLPNYVGELFSKSKEDTPFLSAIGGLTGGKSVDATQFEWQYYDLRDAEDNRQRVEGYAAQAGDERVRANATNVVEIHQEWVDLSYTKLAASGQRATNSEATVVIGGQRIPASELAFQVEAQYKQVARDVNKSFITGTYNKPANNSTARRTRGLLEAITTNVEFYNGVTLGNSNSLKAFKAKVLDLMQEAWDNGGIRETETRTIMVGSTLKRALSEAFITEAGYSESTRNVGGVDLQTIETDFGRCNIMLEAAMPSTSLVVVSLEDCAPAFLEIPGKGHFFAEPLPVSGASVKVQLYGEIGLEYGNEAKHAKLVLDES